MRYIAIHLCACASILYMCVWAGIALVPASRPVIYTAETDSVTSYQPR